MIFIKKGVSFLRNKLYGFIFTYKQGTLYKKKIRNANTFRQALFDQTDTLYIFEFIEGYKIAARGRDLGGVSEVCLLEDYTKNIPVVPGMIVYDIGSCIGDFAVLAAFRGAEVIAIEPDKDNYEILLKNIALNNLTDKITPLNIAVDAAIGWVGFSNSELNTGGHTLAEHADFQVPAQTLTSIMDTHNHSKVDLVKIDIEGGEYRVFSNKETAGLSRIQTIVGEYHLDIYKSQYAWATLKRALSKDFARIRRRRPYYFEAHKSC